MNPFFDFSLYIVEKHSRVPHHCFKDVMDKDINASRRRRWDMAFDEVEKSVTDAKHHTNRKASIVIEHLIQASDIAHTMQVSSMVGASVLAGN